MKRRALGDLAVLLGATLCGRADAGVTGVAIDSRACRGGDLFVALAGEHVDGHEFVPDAAARGAGAALVSRRVAVDLPQLVVADPLAALQRLAADERSRAGYRLVGITGSMGKTTTKEFLAALLATTFRTGATRGSRNSQAGLPAELCSQDEDLDWMVAELGMNHRGELDRLGALTRPDALLYTVIGPVHLEYFRDVDAIAEAKAELIPHLAGDGLLILNAADPRVSALATRFAGRTIRYGAPHGSQLWIEQYRSAGLMGATFDLVGDGARCAVEWTIAGRHQAENLLAAACCATALGVPLSAVPAVAAGLVPAPHRGAVHRRADGITIVDDSYNASPQAVHSLLGLLAESPGRRVAVLGEMLELGPRSGELHAATGAEAARCADVVIAVGGEPARALADAAGGTHVGDAAEALRLLGATLRPGDIVLVKGSRGIGLDRVVAGLLEEAA